MAGGAGACHAGGMSTPRVAVVFDLDGTLVDSEPNYYQAGRLIFTVIL